MAGYRYRGGALLSATVTPYASAALLRTCGPQLEAEVRRLQAVGAPMAAHQLLEAVRQMQRAAVEGGRE